MGSSYDKHSRRNSRDSSCYKKVKRKFCDRRNSDSDSSTSSEIRVTRNYDDYYRREFNRVSVTEKDPGSNPKGDFVETLNVANLPKELVQSKGTKKKNSHAHEVLAKWM